MKRRSWLWTVGGLALQAAWAWAAEPNADLYEATPTKPPVPWLTLAYMVAAIAAVAVVSFKNAKRTHLD